MIFFSHDISVVKYISDRIAVMYLGRLVELGPAAEVVENPLHPYTKALTRRFPCLIRGLSECASGSFCKVTHRRR